MVRTSTPNRRSLSPRLRRRLLPILFLAPAGLLLVLVIGYPLVRAILLTFQDFNMLNPARTTWVGLQNFVQVFHNPVFFIALRNTVVWVASAVSLQLVFGFIGALLLNQPFFGRDVVRGVLLIPWATPSVLVALMWMWMLDGNYGIINELLVKVGILKSFFPFLSSPHTALPTLITIDVWQGIPFFAVMLLAALQAIPTELEQAARVDGANPAQVLWFVKVPLLLPTILITTILRLIWTANYMDLMFVMTNGGPGYATTTMPFFAYTEAYRRIHFSTGATVAFVQALLLGIVILVYIRLLRRQQVV